MLESQVDEDDVEDDGPKVRFAAGPDDGAPKPLKKRGTGFIQADQLQKMLAECEEEDLGEEQFDAPRKESLSRYSGMAVYINQDQLRRSLREQGEEVDF